MRGARGGRLQCYRTVERGIAETRETAGRKKEEANVEPAGRTRREEEAKEEEKERCREAKENGERNTRRKMLREKKREKKSRKRGREREITTALRVVCAWRGWRLPHEALRAELSYLHTHTRTRTRRYTRCGARGGLSDLITLPYT